MILNGLPWKRTEIILSFLRLHPSTAFQTLLLTLMANPLLLREIDGKTVETVSDFILGGYKITADGACSHEIKRQMTIISITAGRNPSEEME